MYLLLFLAIKEWRIKELNTSWTDPQLNTFIQEYKIIENWQSLTQVKLCSLTEDLKE